MLGAWESSSERVTVASLAPEPARRLRRLTLSIGYRFQPSSRHFVGTVEQPQRDQLNSEIVNVYHLLDVGVIYQVTPRWSVHGSLPILFATRDQKYVPRGFYRVNSIGDLSVGARTWVFRPPTESGSNVAFGFSLKFPTGAYDATGLADRRGQAVIATADQSIQAGDGAFGFSLDTQAFKRTFLNSTLYFFGVYLFNPRNTNGVGTFRTRAGEEVMSVTDQYLFRGGISHAVPKLRGLAASFGGRIEGVPVRDAFGKSDGFRRPGYSISVEPGLAFRRGRHAWNFSLPVAVERNRRRSVPDFRNGVHGDAAFADYAVILGYARSF